MLAASTEDPAGDQRREFVVRAAANDWDAVVMARSAFERIPVQQPAHRTAASGGCRARPTMPAARAPATTHEGRASLAPQRSTPCTAANAAPSVLPAELCHDVHHLDQAISAERAPSAVLRLTS